MKTLFVKGLIFGLGLLLPFICASGIVYASTILVINNQGIGKYDLTARGYEFTWTEEIGNCVDLSQETGYPVIAIDRGDIEIGYKSVNIDKAHTIQVPITKKGIRIVFASLPSIAVMQKLDYEMGIQSFQRVGGKSVVDTLQKADASVIK